MLLTDRQRSLVMTSGLAATFVAASALWALTATKQEWWAVDIRIYREAAIAALTGGDPWAATARGLTFAAPPPTLLVYLPAAIVPEPVAIVAYGALSLAAAIFVIRRLDLPLWWLFFPPLFEALTVLNPDVFVIALLLVRGPAAGLGAVVKIYGAVPLLLQRRLVPLAVAVGVSLLSIPWWPDFIAHGLGTHDLQGQAYGLSAWGTWLVIPTIVALLVLRRRGAEWLVVPALWPFTQLHYAAIAMPAARRSFVLAFLLSFAIPLLPAVAVIVEAIRVVALEIIERRRAQRQGAARIHPSMSA